MPKKSIKKQKPQEETQISAEVTENLSVPEVPAVKPKKATVAKSHSKKYLDAKTKIDKSKFYSVADALAVLKKIAQPKFVPSIEIHLNTIEKGIKQTVALPFGTGKQIRVAIVSNELLEQIGKGVIDFDVLITEPSFMPRLAKYAKILGPKGLMPNPKNGTIAPDTEKAKAAFSKGQIQVKTESNFPIIHQIVGKMDMKPTEIEANIKTIIEAVKKIRLKSVFIKTTMSPSLKLDLAKI